MSEYANLKKLIQEARAETTASVLSESATLPDLIDHHEMISDHLHSGKHSPELHAKLKHVHQRLTNTINNVKELIDKHNEQADWHDEKSQEGGSDDAPYSHHDFDEEVKHEVRSHLRDVEQAHEEVGNAHYNAAEWHRGRANELEDGSAEIPDHLIDDEPFEHFQEREAKDKTE